MVSHRSCSRRISVTKGMILASGVMRRRWKSVVVSMMISITPGKQPQHFPRFAMAWYTIPGVIKRQASISKKPVTTSSISLLVMKLQLQTIIAPAKTPNWTCQVVLSQPSRTSNYFTGLVKMSLIALSQPLLVGSRADREASLENGIRIVEAI